MYPIVEKFVSVNGEGQRAGELAVFIRMNTCNLACRWCDTAWAAEGKSEAQWLSAEEIHQYILSTGVRNVTLTGGEPLIQEGIQNLLVYLTGDTALSVEVETNGSVSLEPYTTLVMNRPSFTMDWKLPDSGMESHMVEENLLQLKKKDTVKFVVASARDLNRAEELIRKYDLCNRTMVYFSSVFEEIQPADIVSFMKDKQLNDARLQLQMHKFIWPPEMRGV